MDIVTPHVIWFECLKILTHLQPHLILLWINYWTLTIYNHILKFTNLCTKIWHRL
jgi:hypothetical protein